MVTASPPLTTKIMPERPTSTGSAWPLQYEAGLFFCVPGEPGQGGERLRKYRPRVSDQRRTRHARQSLSEAAMSIFDYIDERLTALARPVQKDGRLPLWLSILVIVILSALCWAVLIATVLALRPVL